MQQSFSRALALWVLLAVQCAAPAVAAAPDEAPSFGISFESGFWLNLHHTLYAATTSGRARMARPSEDIDRSFSEPQRRAWQAALAFYRREFHGRDLRRGRGMITLRDALGRSKAELDGAISGELRQHLESVAPAYRHHLWPAYDEANRQWIEDVTHRLEEVGSLVIPHAAKLLKSDWIRDPATVQVVYHGRAYTTASPIVTVIASSDDAYSGWAGAEMVIHEVGHAIAGPLQSTIMREAAAAKYSPGELWHAAFFYLIGESWRQELARRGISYRPYVEAAGLFSGTWSRFQRPIRTHLGPYAQGRVDADTAFNGLVTELAREDGRVGPNSATSKDLAPVIQAR